MYDLRAGISHVSEPIGRWLHRRGATADMVTVLGTIVSVAASLFFFPRDLLFWGTVVVTVFVLFDTLDGAVARAAGGGTRFGGFLDSVCDRVADGALFAAIVWWCFETANDRPLAAAALFCLVAGQVTSYVKSRADAAGLTARNGWIERPERLIITLVGTGLHGLKVPFALDVALYALAVLSLVTVLQRIVSVHRSSAEQGHPGNAPRATPGDAPRAASGDAPGETPGGSG